MNYEISIDECLDHKIFYSHMPENYGEYGVSGLCIIDENYNNENVSIRYNDINFRCKGAFSEFDNVICNKQHIYIRHKNVKSMFFLGFNEFGNYEDDIIILDNSKNEIRKKIFFYGFNQLLDTLYSIEMNDYCNIAVNTLANEYMNVSIYGFELKLEGQDVEEIILPDNPEMHIMAISLIEE